MRSGLCHLQASQAPVTRGGGCDTGSDHAPPADLTPLGDAAYSLWELCDLHCAQTTALSAMGKDSRGSGHVSPAAQSTRMCRRRQEPSKVSKTGADILFSASVTRCPPHSQLSVPGTPSHRHQESCGLPGLRTQFHKELCHERGQ